MPFDIMKPSEPVLIATGTGTFIFFNHKNHAQRTTHKINASVHLPHPVTAYRFKFSNVIAIIIKY